MTQRILYIIQGLSAQTMHVHAIWRELDCPLKWVGTSSVLPPALANLSSKEYEHVNYPPW
jgi:hypothetical protein